MKKLLLLLIASVFTGTNADAQFQKLYNSGETATNFIVHTSTNFIDNTRDSGYIFSGHHNSSSSPGSHGLMIKTDRQGTQQWSKYYGSKDNSTDFGQVREFTSSTGQSRYVAIGKMYGSTASYQGYGLMVITNNTGVPVNTRGYEASFENIQKITHPTDGPGLVITGSVIGPGAYQTDILVMRTDLAGNIKDAIVLEKPESQQGTWIEQLSDGGYILTGWTEAGCKEGPVNSSSAIAIKLDASLNIVWNRTFSYNGLTEHGVCVKEDFSGNIVITGFTTPGNRAQFGFLTKLGPDGDLKWYRTFGDGINITRGHGLLVDKTNNHSSYVVTGVTNSSLPQSPHVENAAAMVFKTDNAGNLLWSKKYGTDHGLGYSSSKNEVGIVFNYDNAAAGKGYTVARSLVGAGYALSMDHNGNSGQECEWSVDLPRKYRSICFESTTYTVTRKQIPYKTFSISYKDIVFDESSCTTAHSDQLKQAAAGVLSGPGIVISPNPVSSTSVISFGPLYNGGKLQLLNSQGEIILEALLELDSVTLEMEQLPASLYFVNLITPEGTITTRKIIKE